MDRQEIAFRRDLFETPRDRFLPGLTAGDEPHGRLRGVNRIQDAFNGSRLIGRTGDENLEKGVAPQDRFEGPYEQGPAEKRGQRLRTLEAQPPAASGRRYDCCSMHSADSPQLVRAKKRAPAMRGAAAGRVGPLT